MPESLKPTGRFESKQAIMNPLNVKYRTLEFFKGFDLNELGERQNGLVTVKTTANLILNQIFSDAYVNGIPVAGILRTINNQKETLQTKYIIRGQESFGKYFNLLTIENDQNKKKPKDIRIVDGNSGVDLAVEDFDIQRLKVFASIAGLKKTSTG